MSEELPPLDEAVTPPDTGSEVPDPVAPDFRSMLDPSFANDPAIAKFTNVNDLVKEHICTINRCFRTAGIQNIERCRARNSEISEGGCVTTRGQSASKRWSNDRISR